MNQRIAIPIIGVLAVGLIATGVFYLQGTNKLEDAQTEIAGLQGDVSGLEEDLAATEEDLEATEGDLAATEVDLAAVEATNSTLEVGLADSVARVATLETELDDANSATQTQLDRNLTLSEELLTVKDPRHFETLEELEAWLAQDDTNTNTRLASATPAERAFILQVRALRDGYLLPAWFEDFNFLDIDVDGVMIMVDHLDQNHFDGTIDFVGNLAYIGDAIYYVWAEEDFIVEFAVALPLIPSHPQPLE